MSVSGASAEPLGVAEPPPHSGSNSASSYGPVVALAVAFAFGCFLLVMPIVLLVVHPGGSSIVANAVIGQRQSAKTALYLASFAAILPLAVLAAGRVSDAIASGPNAVAAPVLSALVLGALWAMLVLVRLSHRLPWGDGLGTVLAGAVIWVLLTGAALTRATRAAPWQVLLRIAGLGFHAAVAAGVLLIALLLSVTNVHALRLLAVGIGVLVVAAIAAGYGRWRLRAPGRVSGAAVDVAVIAALLLAIPDVVVFSPSSGIPDVYFAPGVIQFQQDWILGPVNQLLAGGTLLVNSPSSQYGVGLVYFLAGWFHLAPIGYGTFGLLDGILTALFYIAAYALLRIAGVGRLLAVAALGVAVAAIVYGLHFGVGALPEQGPLRFGLPIGVILALVASERWPQRATTCWTLALLVLAVASIWAIEAFAYTAFTFLVLVAVKAWPREPAGRLRWFVRRLVLAACACIAAHLLFALATLAGSGRLPHYGDYLAYVHGLLLGGREGSITFGFERWSPGLAVGGACLASAAALLLLLHRLPSFARRERVRIVAIAGTTAYAIAAFSYSDNRSSTYLLLYVALPVLITVVLWLSLLLAEEVGSPVRVRRGALALAASVAALMTAAAWPAIGSHFSRSALAHAYPGGGLRSALHRLWHPPPIDPRAPEAERLVKQFLPGRRVTVLMPTAADLAVETLMRSGRAQSLFIGDPNGDTFIPSVWKPKLARQIATLRPGERILTSRDGLAITARSRAMTPDAVLSHPLAGGNAQLEWIMRMIDQRFELRPIAAGGWGLVVVQLRPRPA